MARADARDEIDARLQAVAEMSAAAWPQRAFVDMAADAVAGRLRACAEISALALELADAGAQHRLSSQGGD